MSRRFASLAFAGLPLALIAQQEPEAFKLGDHTLPADCAELRPTAAADTLPIGHNAFALLQKIRLPELETGEKTFVDLNLAEIADPAHQTTPRAGVLLIKYADALADWDAALSAPVYTEPAIISFEQTRAADFGLKFKVLRELALAHTRRIRLSAEAGDKAGAMSDWLTLREGLDRFSRKSDILVHAMIWSAIANRTGEVCWRLTPTREEALRVNRQHAADNHAAAWKRTALGELRFYMMIQPVTNAQIQAELNRGNDTYSVQGVNTVTDYRVKISPAWGTPAERAREGLTELHRLAAAGAESPDVFTARLKQDSPFFKRFTQICEAPESSDPIHPFEMVYFTALNTRITLRLSDVVLALRAYAGEHAGRYPARLDELVPAYLDAVPIDPFDGAPLRYDPVRPAVWSIGPDRVDDAGTVAGVTPRLRRHQGDVVSTPPANFTRPTDPARSTPTPTPGGNRG